MDGFRFWMHGMGGDSPGDTARELADTGFGAVVAGGDANVSAVVEAGMESWLCGGAFRVRGAEEEGAFLAVGVRGERQEWFHSGCPNEPAIRERNIEAYREMAATEGVTGILVDGCRFASPASGLDAFLTCFCARCEARAGEMGFDYEAMRRDVGALERSLRAAGASGTDALAWRFSASGFFEWLLAHPGVLEWLRFREVCAREHLAAVSRVIRDGGKRVGMYIFTPSLAPLVGQSYRELVPHVDVFAPMIYRNYPKSPGPACLNWELTNIAEELGVEGGGMEEEIMGGILEWMGMRAGLARPSVSEVREGLPVGATVAEAGRARGLLPAGKELAPIVTIRDAEMGAVVEGVRGAGAHGINFFSYAEDWRECLRGAVR